jgi:uncharacterized repeat protein (TIGR01451 family)
MITGKLPLAHGCFGKLTLRIAVAVGILSTIAARSAQAVPLNCSDIYFSDSGNFSNPNILGGLYYISTVDGSDVLVGRFPNSTISPTQFNRAGGTIAIIGGASPTAYASSNTFATAGSNLQSFDVNGNNGTDLPTAILTAAANGMAAAPDGTLQYLANVGGTQQLYRFPNLNSASVLVGNVTPPVGDTIFNTLTAGDNAFDGNGRHYYFASANGNGNIGYLYYIDSTRQAHLLGSVPTIGGATGLAFDGAGNLYTSSQGQLNKITTNNGFGYITIIGTPAHSIIDMASCALPVINPIFDPNDGISKKVRNTTTSIATNQAVGIQNTGIVGDVLEYQVTIKNSGNLPSDTTKFIDIIPAGTTYKTNSTQMCDSTGNNCVTVADLSGGLAPFKAAGGMEVHSYSATNPISGLVNAGVTSAVIVKFQVTVTATTGSILNTGTVTYPVANSGIFTTNSLNSSPAVRTTLSVNVSGKVWNDTDGSGRGGFNLITTPPGEVGTNAGGLYAILLDGTTPNPQAIGSAVIAANGTYNFPAVTPNQTGLKIQLSTTTVSSLPNATIPLPDVPTGWKSTTPKVVPAFNVGIADIINEDFGIAQSAKVILVKRITGIKLAGSSAWVRTLNPRDNTPLNNAIHNPLDTVNNDSSTVNKWPDNQYLVGAYDAGKIMPGDELEYTIYYLSTQGTGAKSLNICDPIRGTQTYTTGSMQMLPGGASTPISLTDAVDVTIDRANSYTAGNAPSNCSTSTTNTGRDNGGVVIQLVGTGASIQPDLAVIRGATAAGIPPTSYGWLRFTTKIDP